MQARNNCKILLTICNQVLLSLVINAVSLKWELITTVLAVLLNHVRLQCQNNGNYVQCFVKEE